MNDKNVFELFNPSVGKLNVALDGSDLYFCVNDIATILGITPKNFVKRHNFFFLPKFPIETKGGTQMANFIPEFTFRDIRWEYTSTKAQRLEDWISREIVPSFRKIGEQDPAKKKESKPNEIVIEILIDFDTQEIKSRIING